MISSFINIIQLLGNYILSFFYAMLIFFSIPTALKNNLHQIVADKIGTLKNIFPVYLHEILPYFLCICIILVLICLVDAFCYYFLHYVQLTEPSFLQITRPLTILTQQKKEEDLKSILTNVRHHSIHDHPIIEPNHSELMTLKDSENIFKYLGFHQCICLKSEFIIAFKKEKEKLKMESKSYKEYLYFLDKNRIFYRKIMIFSFIFLFSIFLYHIHKEQFVLSDETYNPTLPFTFIYPLFAMLLFVGGIGYARQNRKINIATYSLFLKKPQTKPWFLKL